MKKFENLDDYFAQARKEEPVFNLEQASALIDKFTRENLSETPNNSNIKKLFSKKGVKTMTWFSTAATAGIIAIALLMPNSKEQSSEKENKNVKTVVVKSNDESKNETKATKEVKRKFVESQNATIFADNRTKNSKTNNNSTSITEKELNTPVSVEGVNIINATEKQMNELGIKLDNVKKTIQLAFFKNNPMLATIGGNDPKDNITTFERIENAPKYSPKLVTDYKGVRKIMAFEENNSSMIEAYSNKSIDLKSMFYKSRGLNPDSIDNVELSLKLATADSVLNGLEKYDLSQETFDKMDSSMKKEFLNAIVMKFVSILGDSVKISNPQVARNETEEAKAFTFTINEAFEDEAQAKKLLSTINNDTVKTNSSQMTFVYRTIDDNDANGSSKDDIKPINLNEMREKMDKHIQINTLVPVFIPCPTDFDKNYGYLVWYEATPEFLEILPNNIKQEIVEESKKLESSTDICEIPKAGDEYFDVWRACSGAVENLKAYPNPCKDNLNLKFNLVVARTLSISLHDLAGNRLSVLSNAQNFNAGEINRDIDLAQFPSGMYLIVIQTDSGEQAVQRIIKE